MEKWHKDGVFPKSATVDGDVVTIKHVTQVKDGKHYMATRIDLSSETPDSIKTNAAYNYLIQVIRPRVLKVRNSKAINENLNLKPCDYPGNGGGGLTTEQRNVKFLKEIGLDDDRVRKVMSKPEGLAEAINKALEALNNKPVEKVETKLRKNNV